MSGRAEIERLLLELYAARVGGDLTALCAKFTDDAHFQVAGASNNASPVAMKAVGSAQVRPLLSIMVKSFKLSEQSILTMLIDGSQAAVHWRAKVYSRITGTSVLTELMDLVQVRDGRIASYIEFLVPR
jgi:ketosteroid isomerase-like protein